MLTQYLEDLGLNEYEVENELDNFERDYDAELKDNELS